MYEIIFLLFRNIFRSETARLLLRITFWSLEPQNFLTCQILTMNFFLSEHKSGQMQQAPLQLTVFLWSLYPLGICHLLTGWHSVGQSGTLFKKRCAQKADTGSETSRGWLQVVFLTAFSPHPTSPSFSFSSSDQLSRGCISYFTKRKTQGKIHNKKTPRQFRKLCICLGVSNEGERRDRTGSVFQKQGKCCDHVETKFTGNQIDLTYLWGGVKWFLHRLSTTLLKRICLNNLESVWPRLFLNSTIIPDPVIHIHKS